MSNSFKPCPKHFSKGGEKISWGIRPLASPAVDGLHATMPRDIIQPRSQNECNLQRGLTHNFAKCFRPLLLHSCSQSCLQRRLLSWETRYVKYFWEINFLQNTSFDKYFKKLHFIFSPHQTKPVYFTAVRKIRRKE